MLPTDSDPVRWLVRLAVLFVLWRMGSALWSRPHFPAYVLSTLAAGTVGWMLGGLLGCLALGCGVIVLWYNSNRWPNTVKHEVQNVGSAPKRLPPPNG